MGHTKKKLSSDRDNQTGSSQRQEVKPSKLNWRFMSSISWPGVCLQPFDCCTCPWYWSNCSERLHTYNKKRSTILGTLMDQSSFCQTPDLNPTYESNKNNLDGSIFMWFLVISSFVCLYTEIFQTRTNIFQTRPDQTRPDQTKKHKNKQWEEKRKTKKKKKKL